MANFERLENMTFEQIYLIYFNDFLTIDRMAEHYQVPIELLEYWIIKGRAEHLGEAVPESLYNINTLYSLI